MEATDPVEVAQASGEILGLIMEFSEEFLSLLPKRTPQRRLSVRALMDYRIGNLLLRPRRQLTDGGKSIALGRKALEILSVLAEASGTVVTKDELMDLVWPGLIVEENAIQVHVAAIRRALGEAAEHLATVRGIGYQLWAEPCEPFAAFPRVEALQPLVAVLAFECQSDVPGSEWFTEGVSEEILLNVARIDGVSTIARSSSFQLRGENRRAAAVARELGATHVLDGSVRRQDDRVRILAQLCTAPDGATIWCDSFDGTLIDLFAVQEAVAQATAAALRRRLAPRDAIASVHPRAYDLYLQGRQISGSEDQRAQCVSLYRTATEIDANFADAWASLALSLAYAARFDKNALPFDKFADEAKEAAERALSIDPFATNAHHALGLLEPFAHYSIRERHLEAARAGHALNPESLREFGAFAYTVGRMREGVRFMEEFWKLDPLNVLAVDCHCSALFHQGLKEEAYAAYRFAREKWPNDWRFHWIAILIAAYEFDWDEVDRLLAEPGADRPELAHAIRTSTVLRNPDDATCKRILAAAESALAAQGRVDPAFLIHLHALGLRDETFDLARRSRYDNLFARDGHGRDGAGFPSSVIFTQAARPMREDPRFLTLCSRLGLCSYWIDSGRWPDCADEVAYDFRTAAKQEVQVLSV